MRLYGLRTHKGLFVNSLTMFNEDSATVVGATTWETQESRPQEER